MMGQEVIDHYVIRNYGNSILNDPPEFSEERSMWISRLRSDYPIRIHDDRRSSRTLKFIKVPELGYVVFDDMLHLKKDLTSTPEEVEIQLENYLNMWRAHVENLVVSATADKIASLPEVMNSLNPIYEIVNYVLEDGYITIDMLDRSDSAKSNRYISLLEQMGIIRKHEEKYVEGNALVTLQDLCRDKGFNDLVTKNNAMILESHYSYLRHVIQLTSLQRLINVENIVYYPEFYMKDAVPRDRKRLLQEYNLEYRAEIAPPSLSSNLRKLRDLEIIERTDSLYHGTKDIRNHVLELYQSVPSPETVWSVASPI
jgi:hypothetical protein